MACAEGGGSFEPPKEGRVWGGGGGALVTGQCQEVPVPVPVPAHRGAHFESYALGYLSPPPPPASPVGLSWDPITGAQKGGGSGKGARTPPPPVRKPIFPHPQGLLVKG